MTYQEAVDYLLSIPKFSKKNEPIHTKEFIRHLGKYEEWENVIHVAGTNGKGSVCAYLSGILTESGYRVGMFTSPHLIKVNERFMLNNMPVSDEEFTTAFCKVKDVVNRMIEGGRSHPTFFEFLVGMAFVIFEKAGIDYLVLETGMGGRLDATNVVIKPLAVVITSIGHDHTEYLGETLEEIAWEKAGIIKRGVPVIFDANQERVNAVIQQKASELQAKVYKVESKNLRIIKNTNKNIDFYFHYEYDKSMLLYLETSAIYQVMNAALAVQVVLAIDKEHPMGQIQKGLQNVVWNGRMEWITSEVLLDGAHNIEGIRQAIQTIKHIAAGKSIVLLFTAAEEKHYKQMIETLCRELSFLAVVVTELSQPRAAKGEELMHIFKDRYKGNVYLEKNIAKAVEWAMQMRGEDTFVFCTGSLYLIGELRRYFLGKAE